MTNTGLCWGPLYASSDRIGAVLPDVQENVNMVRNTLFLQMRSLACRLVSARKIEQKKTFKASPGGESKSSQKKEYTRAELADGYEYLKKNLPDEDEPLAQIEWLSRERLVSDENSPIFGWPTSMLGEASIVVATTGGIVAVDIYR